MKSISLTRRELWKWSAAAGMGLAVDALWRCLPIVNAAETKQYYYRLNDLQDFIHGFTSHQFGIGYGPAWGIAKLGEPAMVASNLGGFPFQPGVIDDTVYGQMLDLSVHRLTKSERKLLDEKGAYILDTARRQNLPGLDYACSAFHVYPPDGFSHMEVTLKLPRGVHEKTYGEKKVTTGIDNTFVGVWIMADQTRLSDDLAALQKTKGLSDMDAERIKKNFADVNVEIDVMEAVGHKTQNLSFIMSGAHLQGDQAQSSDSQYYDRQFFYTSSAPTWIQFMADNSALFNWATDYLNVVFEFDPDGHWRTYFNEIEMVNSKAVIEKAGRLKEELLRRIPVRTITTPVGPLTISYYIIFNAAAGGRWPGQPTAPNDTARDGMQVANLLLR